MNARPARPRLRGAAVLALAASLAACAGAPPGRAHGPRWFGAVRPSPANVLRFNNDTEPETLDPGRLSGQPDARAAMLLFEGLTTPDPRTLEPLPGQAARWETSADGRTVSFHLRPRLAWSDGTPLTAADFAWSWRRALAPATASRSAGLLYAIAGAEGYNTGRDPDPAHVGLATPDDSTLVVRLVAPTPCFTYLTSCPVCAPVPRAVVERWGARWTDDAHLVGNGPFVLARHRPGRDMTFARNVRYRDAAHVALDGVVAYAIDDLSTATNLYKAGMLDWNPSGDIPSPLVPRLRRYADYATGDFLATYFYSINVTRPPFGDVHVRRALALAIDREAIARDLLHGTRRAWGRITAAGSYAAGAPGPAPLAYDPAAARRELALAGFPGGRGFPRFAILFSTSEDHRRIAEAVQAMWKRTLGIDVELDNRDWASTMDATTHLRYAVARRSWIADYPDPVSFLEPLRTGDGNNRTGWSDARYDSLLAAAAREADPARRAALLARAEAIALDAAPFVPILQYATHELVKPYVRGLYPTRLDVHPLAHVAIARGATAGAEGAWAR